MLDYPILHAPDIARDRFIRLLALAGSPAAPGGWVLWDTLARKGVSQLFFLGMFNHESRCGMAGICAEYGTHSPGNVRSIQNPEHGGVVVGVPGRGNFVRYASWEAGTLDWCDRLLGPKYAGAGLTTVRQVIPKWAPASDGNVPTAYIASVLSFIARHADQEQLPVPTIPPYHVDHLPADAVNRPGQRITPRYFTVHETANGQPGATAAMHRSYVHSGGGPQLTSYNLVVDDIEAFELVPFGESSNHAGTPQGNLSGLSMELCVNSAPDSPEWQRVQDHALAIIARTYKNRPTLLPVAESLVPHRHWRSTACPARLTGAAWEAFRARAVALVNGAPGNTDPLLDAEYDRLGGAATLGAKVVKARLDWTVDWGGIDSDVLIAERGVVSVAPPQTETAQRMFTDKAREALEAAGVLRVY